MIFALSVIQLFFVIPICIMYGLNLIPLFAPLWQYSASYYITIIMIGIINIFILISHPGSIELLTCTYISNIFGFIITCFI